MSEALTPEERKQRIKEKYRNAVIAPPVFAADRLCAVVYRRTSPQPFEQTVSNKLIELEYQERAKRYNCILKGIYVDEGWDDHTALDKLLDDCREIDVVFIPSPKHLSCDMNKALEITRELEARSVVVYFGGGSIMGSEELEGIISLSLPPPDIWKIHMQWEADASENILHNEEDL